MNKTQYKQYLTDAINPESKSFDKGIYDIAVTAGMMPWNFSTPIDQQLEAFAEMFNIEGEVVTTLEMSSEYMKVRAHIDNLLATYKMFKTVSNPFEHESLVRSIQQLNYHDKVPHIQFLIEERMLIHLTEVERAGLVADIKVAYDKSLIKTDNQNNYVNFRVISLEVEPDTYVERSNQLGKFNLQL